MKQETVHTVSELLTVALTGAGLIKPGQDTGMKIVVKPDENVTGDDEAEQGHTGLVEIYGYYIYPSKVEIDVPASIGKPARKETVWGWQVDAGVTIPGCHTMPNGDPGYPDDYDWVEQGRYQYARQAVMAVVMSILHDMVDGALQAHAEAKDYEEMQRQAEQVF